MRGRVVPKTPPHWKSCIRSIATGAPCLYILQLCEFDINVYIIDWKGGGWRAELGSSLANSAFAGDASRPMRARGSSTHNNRLIIIRKRTSPRFATSESNDFIYLIWFFSLRGILAPGCAVLDLRVWKCVNCWDVLLSRIGNYQIIMNREALNRK